MALPGNAVKYSQFQIQTKTSSSFFISSFTFGLQDRFFSHLFHCRFSFPRSKHWRKHKLTLQCKWNQNSLLLKQSFWNTWLQCDTHQTIIINREEYPTLHFLKAVCLGKSINDSISSKSSWFCARLGTCTEGVVCVILMGCLPQLESSGPDPALYLDDTSAVVTLVLSWGSANTFSVTPGAWRGTWCKAKCAGFKHLCWAGNRIILHQVCTPVVMEMAKGRLVLASAVFVP